MSTSRLQQQFIRLWQRYNGQSTETTLQALAEVLNCSRRHVRSLLGKMQHAAGSIGRLKLAEENAHN